MEVILDLVFIPIRNTNHSSHAYENENERREYHVCHSNLGENIVLKCYMLNKINSLQLRVTLFKFNLIGSLGIVL